MSCYCAVTRMPPCGYCERSFECDGCHKTRNSDEDGMIADPVSGAMFCQSCADNNTPPPEAKTCECGKDKHGFAVHSNWCPKYS